MNELELFQDFPTDKYAVIVIDPPWKQATSRSTVLGSDFMPYPTLSIRQIQKLPIKDIASDNCILYLWVLPSTGADAYDLCWHWGFKASQELIWVKTSSGKLQIGMGCPLRYAHERCIVATRGKVTQKIKNVPTVLLAARTKHSVKPDKFYNVIESLHDGPYCDIFGRRERDGWTVWGS